MESRDSSLHKLRKVNNMEIDDEEFAIIRHALMQEFNHNGMITLGAKVSLKKKFKLPNGLNF